MTPSQDVLYQSKELVETLGFKLEDREFEYRWDHWDFILTNS
jgi:hypothetical protein